MALVSLLLISPPNCLIILLLLLPLTFVPLLCYRSSATIKFDYRKVIRACR